VYFKFSHLALVLVGRDTDHGCLPWLVSPPASENLKCTPNKQLDTQTSHIALSLAKFFSMKWIFASLLFVSAQSLAQPKPPVCTIAGSFSKIKSGMVYLTTYENGQRQQDSAKIQNGKFAFTHRAANPAMASLSTNYLDNDWLLFYTDPGTKMTVTGTGQTLKDLRIAGSQLNDDDRALKNLLQPISEWEERNYELYKKAAAEKNERVTDSLDNLDETIMLEKRKIVAGFVRQKPASLRSAMAIEENYSYYAEAGDVEPLYNALSEKVKKSASGKNVRQMLDVYKTVAVGMPAPDISQPGPDGKAISLSSLRGQYVLVDFWASWCGPCRKENPNLVKAYAQYKEKGLTILGVSYDDKKDRWLAAIQKDGLGWLQVSDLKGWQNASAATYYIKAIPSNVLVDKEGKIIAKNLMGQKLYDKLAELIP
jgi:peroxiredoxin